MALGRALQERAAPPLRAKALAPMSGPFDIAGAELPAVLDGRLGTRVSNYYVSYLLRSWQPIHHVYDRAQDVEVGRLRPICNQTPSSLHFHAVDLASCRRPIDICVPSPQASTPSRSSPARRPAAAAPRRRTRTRTPSGSRRRGRSRPSIPPVRTAPAAGSHRAGTPAARA
jgi:hypothetical protein